MRTGVDWEKERIEDEELVVGKLCSMMVAKEESIMEEALGK